MPTKSPLNIVLGAGNVGDSSIDTRAWFDAVNEVKSFLNAFYERGGRQIDTAGTYSPHAQGSSEPRLAAAEAGKNFAIDTKISSLTPGSHKRENIEKEINTSLAELKIPQVNIEYLHAPDRATPFKEAVEAMDKGYKEGKYKYFGISNYTAEEVESIVKICEEHGFVKPTVYQGQYSPLVRGGEKDLFPVLRKHRIAFYAYSAGAAGFFAGNHKNITPGGRYDVSPEIEAATDKAIAVVAKYGINGHAAALRWTVYHSKLATEFGDAVILGASSSAQLNSNFDMIEQGILPPEVVSAMDELYKEIKGHSEIPYYR